MSKKPKRKKTELGRTLAKVRIDFDETGADMAKKLGISASQMFNIEVGLAQVGYEFIGKIKEVYEIDLSEIMKRGGFMSKITLDLDELSATDRDTVLEIWARRGTDEAPSPTPRETAKASVAAIAEVLPNAEPVRRRRPPPPPPDDIVFLDDDSADELDGIDEVSAL